MLKDLVRIALVVLREMGRKVSRSTRLALRFYHERLVILFNQVDLKILLVFLGNNLDFRATLVRFIVQHWLDHRSQLIGSCLLRLILVTDTVDLEPRMLQYFLRGYALMGAYL